MMDKSRYQEHMDELATRLVETVAGEDSGEVILACCVVMAYSLSLMRPEQARSHYTRAMDFLDHLVQQQNPN